MSGRNRHSYSYSRPVGQLDDRLERDPVELPEAEEVVEHLGLDDLGRLGHPDPLGQPGQLDGGRHRDEVAIALRERVVDRDEAVLGPVGGVGDVGRRGSRSAGRRGRSGRSRSRGRAGARRRRRAARRRTNRMSRDQRRRSSPERRGVASRNRMARMMRPVLDDGPVARQSGPGRDGSVAYGRRVQPSGRRQALSGADRDVEAVLGWCQRARPARVEGARRLEREVEVEDRACRRPDRRRGPRSWRHRRGSGRRRRSRCRWSRRGTG